MKKIHIVAPARSITDSEQENLKYGEDRMESIGYAVGYGDNVYDTSFFKQTASIKNRINDWNNAWSDDKASYILAYNGGTNSNQLLDFIDWNSLKDKQQIFIGYSDLTVLANALYAKTNKVSFLGLNFKYLCRKDIIEYTLKNVDLAFSQHNYSVTPSALVNLNMWGDSFETKESEGWWCIHSGDMSGKVVGGNLPSFRLLYGTEYMPEISQSVVMRNLKGVPRCSIIFKLKTTLKQP